MKKWYLALLVVFAGMAIGGVASAATIKGTISNSTGKTGRIYISLYTNWGQASFGTSLASAGSFTVRGVPDNSGSYTVRAFVDTVGNGVQHANDPRGSTSQINVTSGEIQVGTISLATPDFQAPQEVEIMGSRGTGANLIFWDAGTDENDYDLANSYTIYWSGSTTGSQTLKASDDNMFLHHGGGSTHSYRVTATAGAQTVSSGWITPTGSSGQTVSGTVNFSGTVTGPLCVVLWNEEQETYIPGSFPNPVFPKSYSITNVPAGSYGVFAFLDLNNNGTVDEGDVEVSTADQFISVGTSPVTVPPITITSYNSLAQVSTSHYIDNSYENYSINLELLTGKKRPVAATVTSAPNLTVPIDMGIDDDGEFELWLQTPRPQVGDAYTIQVTHSDGTSATLTSSVTAVLDAPPVPIAPVGPVPYNGRPTFSWQAPSPAPSAPTSYGIWMQQSSNGNYVWDYWDIPGFTTAVAYNGEDDLTDGVEYSWTLGISDGNRNEVRTNVRFTPTNSPAIGGFTPKGGLAGTSVTISGINFNSTPTSNTVRFNGVPAVVTSGNATSLTVTVPDGATTGSISVSTGGKTGTSGSQFLVAAPITFKGVVKNLAGNPLSGVLVEQVAAGNPTATSGADGVFTLTGLFAQQSFQLKLSKSGFEPVYSQHFWFTQNADGTSSPFILFTAEEAAAWGSASGKGVIQGVVRSSSGGPVAGVVVVAQSQKNNSIYYDVKYYSGTSYGTTSTYANGFFTVINVDEGDTVILKGLKSPWTFNNLYQYVRAGITEVSLPGSLPSPYIYSLSSYSEKVGSTVTISGSNFSTTPADNVVKFNGVAAAVTSASATSLTVTVPAGATSGQVSVTTPGGTATSGSWFYPLYTLTSNHAGTGTGTVTITQASTTCTESCSEDFVYGQQVELVASTGNDSVFAGWSGGGCSGTDSCFVTLTSDVTVTATFNMPDKVRLVNGVAYTGKATVQAAYNAAVDGSIIKARALDFSENLNFNRNISLLLKGGYDSLFDSTSGSTRILGNFTLTSGSLTVDNIAVQ